MSNEKSIVSKISGSARKLVVVPRRSPCGPTFVTGAVRLAARVLLAPRRGRRGPISTRSHSDSALTTLTPTPWRPPDTL